MHIGGIPESVIDLQAAMMAPFQELQPALPVERLEMDRVHRAPTPKKPEGPPRNIIAKFHFCQTKKQLLATVRNKRISNFPRTCLSTYC